LDGGIVPVRIKTANKVEYAKKRAVKDSKIVQVVLTTIAILFFIIMLIVPLVSVFVKAFEQERICILLQLPIR